MLTALLAGCAPQATRPTSLAPCPAGKVRLDARGPCLSQEEQAALYATGELWVSLEDGDYLWLFSVGAGEPRRFFFEEQVLPLEALGGGVYRSRARLAPPPRKPDGTWIRVEDGWYVRCGLFYPYPLRLPPKADLESDRIAHWLEEKVPIPFAVDVGPGTLVGRLEPEPWSRTSLGWLWVRPLRQEEARALRMKQAPPDLESYPCWPYGTH